MPFGAFYDFGAGRDADAAAATAVTGSATGITAVFLIDDAVAVVWKANEAG